MCGPSSAEKQISQQSQSFSSMLNSNYQTNFGAQSAIMQNLNNIFTPIAEMGPSQTGFAAPELAAMTTQANQGTGQAYQKAAQALAGQHAGLGGGDMVLPTGADIAAKERLASAAADTMSNENLAITNENYQQGNRNFQQATAGLNALGQMENPNAIAGSAISAGNEAFGQADTVQQQQNQKEMAIAGGLTSLATGGIGGIGGFISHGVGGIAPGIMKGLQG